MATLNAMINLADQQFSSTSQFARWRRACTMALDPGGSHTGGLVALALACGGEVQMSSPLGHWMLRVSRAIEGGFNLTTAEFGPIAGQIGEGPFEQWARRLTIST